jgi:hypothetical protein
MERDNKGRFKKQEEEEEIKPNMLEKAPSLKMIIVLIVLAWAFFTSIPNPGDLKNRACRMVCDSGNNSNGGPGSSGSSPTTPQPTKTETANKDAKS